jgi:outer membrane immunogenic protein
MIIAAALAGSVVSVPAFAETNAFAGPYVGADAGYEDFGRIDSDGVNFGVFAGYNLPVSQTLIAGIEARVGDSSTDATHRRSTTAFTDTVHNSIGVHYGIAARLGAVVGEDNLLFARAGWERARINSVRSRVPNLPIVPNPTPVVEDFGFSDDSVIVGAGYERRLGGKMSARLSYDYAENFDRHTVRAGLVVGF